MNYRDMMDLCLRPLSPTVHHCAMCRRGHEILQVYKLYLRSELVTGFVM